MATFVIVPVWYLRGASWRTRKQELSIFEGGRWSRHFVFGRRAERSEVWLEMDALLSERNRGLLWFQLAQDKIEKCWLPKSYLAGE